MYVERAKMFFKVNDIKVELWLPTLIAAIGDEAYELLSNLISPDKPSAKTFASVVEVLKNHLNRLYSNGMKLKRSKCSFIANEV